MSEEHKLKKVKYTAENVEYYERQYMMEHNIAMGYAPRPPTEQTTQNPPQPSLLEMANAAFPVPFLLHETFRAWIERNRLARFDCFEEPNWTCLCYKCETFRAKYNEQLDLQEKYMDEYMADAIQGPATNANTIDRKMTVQEAAEYDQANNSSSVVRPNVVCHFFSDLPKYEGTYPSTPKFSTIEFNIPDSDHGKEAAQQHWITMMQMTPTRLTF